MQETTINLYQLGGSTARISFLIQFSKDRVSLRLPVVLPHLIHSTVSCSKYMMNTKYWSMTCVASLGV